MNVFAEIALRPLISTPIKVIHIRSLSWLTMKAVPALYAIFSSDDEIMYHFGRRPPLSEDFRHFADWAFGPEGLKSLKVVFYGDASFGATIQDQVVILQRNATMPNNYDIIRHYDGRIDLRRNKYLRDYRDFLESCPSEELFGK